MYSVTKVDSLPKYIAEIETGMAEKSSFWIRHTDGKNLVWFGEIERKLAKLSIPTFTYISSSELFYEENQTGVLSHSINS
jgi:hypothetical protein